MKDQREPARPSLGLDQSTMSTFARLARVEANIDPIIMGERPKYDIAEFARLTGVPAQDVQLLARWMGKTPIDGSGPKFTDSDVEFAGHVKEFAEDENLDQEELSSYIRSISSAFDRLALRQVEAIVQKMAATGMGDTEARLLTAERAPALVPRTLPILEHLWRRQYAEVLRRLTTKAITERGLDGDDREYPLLRAVGFADLVGFTERMKDATPQEFTNLIRDFTDQCWDIVTNRGGRIINFIGDAVFFIANDVQTAAEVALGLSAQGAIGMCGPVRIGLAWARVLTAQGDVFGPGVNLAARLTKAAEPNEVLIESNVAMRLAHSPRYAISDRQLFEARGLGEVSCYRLRYRDDPRSFGHQ